MRTDDVVTFISVSLRPWSGATSILDVYVLAHTDWFIGARGSSYSLLINNLVMQNSVKRGRFENPLYEVLYWLLTTMT